jgi:hypothetical protein
MGPTSSIYTVVPEREAWPEPEVINHEVTKDYLKKSAVVSMVKLAESLGWVVVVTHARGCLPSVGGKPSRQRDSLALRMSRGQERAVAVYTDAPTEGATWSWDSMYRWINHSPLQRYASVTAFKKALHEPAV